LTKSIIKKNNFTTIQIDKIKKKYDLVLLLVPHKIILSKIMKNINKFTNNNSVIFDIKSVLKSSNIAKRGIWML